jgi:hypothetical protein
VRFIFENLLVRTVWLAFFAVAAYLVWRVAIGLYAPVRAPAPAPAPGTAVYGQQEYAQPGGPTSSESSGWPEVPPPPMPNPPSSGSQGS